MFCFCIPTAQGPTGDDPQLRSVIDLPPTPQLQQVLMADTGADTAGMHMSDVWIEWLWDLMFSVPVFRSEFGCTAGCFCQLFGLEQVRFGRRIAKTTTTSFDCAN